MGLGRFVCVGIPFGLTLASLICILITMLSGLASNKIDMFEVNTKNLSISSSSLSNIYNEFHHSKRDVVLNRALPGQLTSAALNGAFNNGVNFTAADFDLADSYKVFVWNYCSTTGSNTTCTKAKYNWAHSSLNTTAINEKAQAVSAKIGQNATLPKDVTDAMDTYATVSKWTQVVYIIAFILTLLELIVGLFGFWSRLGSCATYLVSGFATSAIIAASILATASSVILVGAVNASSKAYGVKATLHTPFLSVTWLACAFSIGAGLFWLFSICCCKNEHRRNKNKNYSEKGFAPNSRPSSYQPIHNPNTEYAGQQSGVYNAGAQKPVHAGAYEPYSHAAV